MKKLLRLLILVVFGTGVLAALPAQADIIEVPGDGMITGKIIKNKDGVVVCEDRWGNQKTYSRDEVTYMQKSVERPPDKKKQKKVADKGAVSGPARGSVKGMPIEFGGGPAAKNPYKATFRRGIDLSDQPVFVQKVNAFFDRLFELALGFLAGDPDSAADSVQNSLGSVFQFQGDSSENMVFAAFGMFLMPLGLIAAMLFGFQLIWVAFHESIGWGLVFLANLISGMASIFGGALGLVLLLPNFLSLYFVISHWQVSRKPIVCQAVAMNVFLMGCLIFFLA